MYHISANLAFGRREKNIWGYKYLGGQEAYKKNRKKSGDLFFFFFFFFFLETVKNLWGRQKMSRGAPNGNVTPLVEALVNELNVAKQLGQTTAFFPEPMLVVAYQICTFEMVD